VVSGQFFECSGFLVISFKQVNMKFQDLLAYQKSFSLAMKIFEMTKRFPKEEMYSLTDQIRRSSRSVSANISESYRKRVYPKNFHSKLTDSDAENSETQVWLEFSLKCNYISESVYNELLNESKEVGKLINYMILNPQKFGVSL
jgi:four helix bundle protein